MTDFNNNSVFQVENKRSNSKLLITVEHAGNLIPKKLNLGLKKVAKPWQEIVFNNKMNVVRALRLLS